MRFSKLRLTGFKSFVDPTDLIIADGLTGVVGPNGCGKSNLLEALRWVMGENRPTAMRGGGMEDVIFAGAATRPARNFAEVSLHLDNSERLAPAGFNDQDALEIVRRITRDVGSAYKTNGKDVRARDVQMLFADASTGAHSPALVRQGQISELINAKPQNRRRVLEEAAGISGLYQRRHEAELKLKGAEQNLARVDDVIEQLASQLAQLARQARQAARYREIGDSLRKAEGQLLYRRWREADEARARAEDTLRDRTTTAAQAEAAVQVALKARATAEEALPPLREEEAIAAAVLQRLTVQRDTLDAQDRQAQQTIETLSQRIVQLTHDIDREGGLNRDAGETIQRLEWEAGEIAKASEGHEALLDDAATGAREAAQVLQAREEDQADQTEDVARLAARHGSAQRLLDDNRKVEARAQAEAEKARAAVATSADALRQAETDLTAAQAASVEAEATAQRADETLLAAEAARADVQAREADARAERSEAEGELNALRAEAGALAKLVERDTAEGGQIVDRLQVEAGFEKALGAALADDLRAPEVDADGPSGWATLPDYDGVQALPAGVTPLSLHVSVPSALARRMSQIGLADADDAARLHDQLQPGQRLVSLEGDLWRWDGFRAWAEDAPSAAALRLQQLNRLEALKQARTSGPGCVRLHQPLGAANAGTIDDDLSHQIGEALEAGQIVAWYQPQVSTDTGVISGFEALARRAHPSRGLVSPGSFIDLARRAGLAQRLSEVILTHSLSALRAWDKAGLDIPNVAVNFGSDDLRNPRIVEYLRWELDRHDISPRRLSIEVLEDVIAERHDDIIARNLRALADLGCGIELDDFGTGYTSILNIRRFSVSRIKIDRKLVARIDMDSDQRDLVAALLAMAERLKIATLGEGVETAAEHALLGQMGCDHVQGFALARPMPLGDTFTWILSPRATVADASPPTLTKPHQQKQG